MLGVILSVLNDCVEVEYPLLELLSLAGTVVAHEARATSGRALDIWVDTTNRER